MNRLHRKRWQAHRDVLCAVGMRGRILHPLTWMGGYSLAGMHIQFASTILHVQYTAKHNREFLKFGPLSRLRPTLRAAHVGDANVRMFRVDPPNVFVDHLRFIAGGFDAGRL